MSSTISSAAGSPTTSDPAASPGTGTNDHTPGAAQLASGMTLYALVTALTVSIAVFGVQMGFFFLLRNKLARIFKPKTYLVPERERTDPPPASPWNLIFGLMKFEDREIIKKCGLDAYFFLRYLQTLLVIFVPIALVVIPILVPINYVGGLGQEVVKANTTNETLAGVPTGLDTLSWGNVAPKNYERRSVHLVLALLVIIWVCGVFFSELRVYVKVRQDYLTSAEHRLRASANTVLVSSIPEKWLSEDALRGLFDVFPGGIRNVWLTRDFTKLLEKIHKRDAVHRQLEAAESDLIRNAKRKQLKLRAAEEKRNRRTLRGKGESKEERAERAKREDEEARLRAEGPGGLSAGAHEEVPDDVSAAVDEAEDKYQDTDLANIQEQDKMEEADLGAKIGGGLAKVGLGLGQGLKKAVGATKKGVDGELERTGGFEVIEGGHPTHSRPGTRGSDRHRRVPTNDDNDRPKVSFASETPLHTPEGRHAHSPSNSEFTKEAMSSRAKGNTTRKATNLDNMLVTDQTKWYQFWKPPTGSYASPIPQGYEGEDFPWNKKDERTGWQKFRARLPFAGEEVESLDYPAAYTRNYEQQPEEDAGWKKWLRPKDRPHHRLARFEWTPSWLPGLPFINKKVDTIYWCRAELARLNLEIEEDQEHPERYPIMNSAFIQFNNQAAAHMACQSVTHHVPKRMAPRMVEISPEDVIWDNMAISWWDGWVRSSIVFALVVGMIILWAFPVAFTASVAQIDALIAKNSWLGFLKANEQIHNVVKSIAGVLPAVLLAILLALVPLILDLLAKYQGSKTGAQKSEVVQVYFFGFLFVQVFLVVSIASSLFQILSDLSKDFTSTPDLLARNLPKSSNYFFTYFLLQAMSTSSGQLLQIGTLFVWYILSRMLDNTAREKWRRNTELPNVSWGSYFPVYTNFACIALIYSVVSPLISLFAIITFSLLWVANRYNMLYVTRFRTDTGGVLYPRAINQTFTGLYVMELCLIGLFGLVEDEDGTNVCVPHSIVMFVALLCTALYQYHLNSAFGPLLRYLPITFEDEAVIRDEVFQRAQAKRLGLIHDGDESASLIAPDNRVTDGDDIELQKIRPHGGSKFSKLNPVKGVVRAGTWAARGGKKARAATFGKAEDSLRTASQYRKRRRQKDLDAQRAIGDALYGGYHDEIEDLTPDERDALVRKAFQHYALRARRPTVWIPRDDIGVSDDEIRRTMEFSEHIWISNEGTALDSKVRIVYGRNPPDFSEVDIINL
ncbi:DUF221-domain-containing protein [Podospora aff. communis PSN243]|uniref:DUF221-domain-containing protein n=1 Tax=Podospora aff. communis PSN243 TaxID=3040156 RepID=A0AAV9H3S5_9PEZI|nr:DUF221-domain-containing protein [Podospora aff. communis PSN243]